MKDKNKDTKTKAYKVCAFIDSFDDKSDEEIKLLYILINNELHLRDISIDGQIPRRRYSTK